MPNIGPLELVVILVIVLLLFGAKRLPELGRSLGSGMKEFKDSVTGKDSDSSRTELDPGDAPEPAETVTRADAPVEAEPRS
ncbi:MAG: twin-arginine translocase TatA/TatE family subunit [Actinobacteria bacterium]|nr:MAG: twin-arginine translocase TatA/TatE family subunit [Actinomycetota bacterium]